MSTKRFSRIQRAAAIVPLALLSAAWTASLAGVGSSAVVSAPQPGDDPHLPDGSSVPSQAIEAPASVSDPEEASDGEHEADAAKILATSTTNGIPSSALAAYQRAETVINSADKSCNLTWQLLAAIGRVESDHGRFGGNALDAGGVARPGIFGKALNGQRGTSVIRDTDAGQLDGDDTYDRAVGPMQFIPSTWSVVGVDADNDGQRNPQDIDDAALAAAVYLCSGDNDLSTVAGQRAAVYRYNHSTSYVNLVLRIMNNYLSGDFMSVPDGTTAAGYLVPEPPQATRPPAHTGKGGGKQDSTFETPAPTTPDGTTGGNDDGGNDDNGSGQPDDNSGNDNGGNSPLPQVSVPPLPSTEVEPLDEVLTLAQAIVQCTLDGINQLDVKAWNQCIKDYTT